MSLRKLESSWEKRTEGHELSLFPLHFFVFLFFFICSQDAPEEQLLNLSIIYTIGYALSFSALVIATAILLDSGNWRSFEESGVKVLCFSI